MDNTDFNYWVYRKSAIMIPKWSSVCALLYVAVCFNLVAAGHPALYRRQDASSTTTAAATTTRDGDGTTTTAQADKSDTTTGSSKPTSVEITTTSSSSTLEPTIIPSAINGNNPSNESYSDDSKKPKLYPLLMAIALTFTYSHHRGG